MSYEMIAILMFSTMMVMLFTGQRVFGAIGFVAVVAALLLWGDRGGYDLGFSAVIKLMKWYPLMTLPMFIFMGYVMSESKIADDLYKMFHVWMGGLAGGLAIGTIGLMVLVSAMNGLSVAGMAIGATIALPELLKRGYDKRMVTGVIQAGSSLGILVPPSVVLVLYAMIARQPVGQLWLAGVFPGLMMATLFIVYIAMRCKITPSLGPVLPREERDIPMPEKLRLLRAGLLPLGIFFAMMVPIRERLDVTGRELGHRRHRGLHGGGSERPDDMDRIRGFGASDARHHLYVHVDHSGGLRVRRGVRRPGRGQGDRRSVHRPAGSFSPGSILILMQLSFILMGTFLDDTAMLVIVAPLYVPLVGALGFDLIWYGVLYTITCQIAYMTPPFGYNLFLMRAMAPPEISLQDIYRSIIPFVIVMVFALALVMVFPQIALVAAGICLWKL
jgi:TRAP-type mannitol/chloroaromatic compound transport system permease large subunit